MNIETFIHTLAGVSTTCWKCRWSSELSINRTKFNNLTFALTPFNHTNNLQQTTLKTTSHKYGKSPRIKILFLNRVKNIVTKSGISHYVCIFLSTHLIWIHVKGTKSIFLISVCSDQHVNFLSLIRKCTSQLTLLTSFYKLCVRQCSSWSDNEDVLADLDPPC